LGRPHDPQRLAWQAVHKITHLEKYVGRPARSPAGLPARPGHASAMIPKEGLRASFDVAVPILPSTLKWQPKTDVVNCFLLPTFIMTS
jgi:hypothetical protein